MATRRASSGSPRRNLRTQRQKSKRNQSRRAADLKVLKILKCAALSFYWYIAKHCACSVPEETEIRGHYPISPQNVIDQDCGTAPGFLTQNIRFYKVKPQADERSARTYLIRASTYKNTELRR